MDSDPAKITSSIEPDRSVEGAWAPSTHDRASEMFDLPGAVGPDDDVDPALELHGRGGREGLEPGQFQSLDVHPDPR